MHILGIRIDNFSKKEIIEKINLFLSDGKFHQIATINPEFILEATKNSNFKEILNKCDLNIADGIGIKYAFLRYGKKLETRFAGVDLVEEILKIADKKKMKIFLACSKNGLSNFYEIKNILKKKYQSIEIFGENISQDDIYSYNFTDKKYDILFCNFGFPNQELFINNIKDAKIGISIGIGGSFDFIVKKIKRAPKIIRFLGFEWLWRFFLEPKYRLKRIFNAVVIFPIKVLINK